MYKKKQASMKDYQSRNDSARMAILGIIKESIGPTGVASPGSYDARLPSESDLARRIGLSVATVREALRTLEQEGYISKKHGMGNYYHVSTLETRMRIDTILDFSDLLADGGHRVLVTQTELHLIDSTSAMPGMERQLCAQVGPLYRYDRIYTADNLPAILTRNYIPLELLGTPGGRTNDGTGNQLSSQENIIDFLWSQARIQVTHSIEAMTPGLADKAERALFNLKVRTPLIRWFETIYTYDDSIVGYAHVTFNPDVMNMHLLRKWS